MSPSKLTKTHPCARVSPNLDLSKLRNLQCSALSKFVIFWQICKKFKRRKKHWFLEIMGTLQIQVANLVFRVVCHLVMVLALLPDCWDSGAWNGEITHHPPLCQSSLDSNCPPMIVEIYHKLPTNKIHLHIMDHKLKWGDRQFNSNIGFFS